MDNIFLNLFGAPKIKYSQIEDISRDAPELIVWAAPVMFFFVLLEWYISYRQNRQLYKKSKQLALS